MTLTHISQNKSTSTSVNQVEGQTVIGSFDPVDVVEVKREGGRRQALATAQHSKQTNKQREETGEVWRNERAAQKMS